MQTFTSPTAPVAHQSYHPSYRTPFSTHMKPSDVGAHLHYDSRAATPNFSNPNSAEPTAHVWRADTNSTKISTVCSSAFVPPLVTQKSVASSSSRQFTSSVGACRYSCVVGRSHSACCSRSDEYTAWIFSFVWSLYGCVLCVSAQHVGTDLSEDVPGSSEAHTTGVAAVSSTKTPCFRSIFAPNMKHR